jgi:hypothetical protein
MSCENMFFQVDVNTLYMFNCLLGPFYCLLPLDLGVDVLSISHS